MTTIAYNKGVLAFDSRVTSGGVNVGSVVKGKKTRKYLIAAAGSCEDTDAWMDWMESGGKLEDRKNYGLDKECDMECVAVDKKGRVFQYGSKCYPYTYKSQFLALGSGWAFAMGAMALGASASEAVKVAAKFDVATGGSVLELKW